MTIEGVTILRSVVLIKVMQNFYSFVFYICKGYMNKSDLQLLPLYKVEFSPREDFFYENVLPFSSLGYFIQKDRLVYIMPYKEMSVSCQ